MKKIFGMVLVFIMIFGVFSVMAESNNTSGEQVLLNFSDETAQLMSASGESNEIPDYTNVSTYFSLINNCVPDRSSFVENSFIVTDSYNSINGEHEGYYVINDDAVFTLTNKAPSNKYVMYIRFIPLFPQKNGSYSTAEWFEQYTYEIDGTFNSFPVDPLTSDSILKLLTGNTVEFSIPSKNQVYDDTKPYYDDIIWIMCLDICHAEAKTITYEGGTTYTYYTQTPGDSGYSIWWFLKVDNDAVNRLNSKFDICYNANGGTGAPENQTKERDKTITLSKTKPERDGYTFKGWAINADGDVVYAPGAKYTENKSLTLYAVWEKEIVAEKKVVLSTSKLSMVIGGTSTLSAEVTPENATYKDVVWSSSDEEIATVDENGLVTALSAGKVKITATSKNGKKATCTVTIGEPATRVDVTALKVTSVAVGKSITIKAKAACEGKTKPVSTAVVFEIIEGEDIATLDAKGKLTAKGLGEVTVRARAEAGTEDAYVDVTINICIPATKVTLNTTKASMIVGDELQLEATLVAKGECTDSLTWSVDKEDIATVDENGVVTALTAGKVKVTALAGSGKKATCTVTIGEPATRVDVTALKVTSVAVGKSITIKAKAACEGKTKPVSTAVVFEIIEGDDIATIDAKGKLTAKAEGTVVVRISAEAGTEEAYEDVEIRICNLATKVTLNMTKATIAVDDELQLEATMTAKGECTDTLTWSVDKPAIATVDKNGLVTAHSAGKVKVTAMAGSGKKATCTITVTK